MKYFILLMSLLVFMGCAGTMTSTDVMGVGQTTKNTSVTPAEAEEFNRIHEACRDFAFRQSKTIWWFDRSKFDRIYHECISRSKEASP